MWHVSISWPGLCKVASHLTEPSMHVNGPFFQIMCNRCRWMKHLPTGCLWWNIKSCLRVVSKQVTIKKTNLCAQDTLSQWEWLITPSRRTSSQDRGVTLIKKLYSGGFRTHTDGLVAMTLMNWISQFFLRKWWSSNSAWITLSPKSSTFQQCIYLYRVYLAFKSPFLCFRGTVLKVRLGLAQKRNNSYRLWFEIWILCFVAKPQLETYSKNPLLTFLNFLTVLVLSKVLI